MGWFDDWYKKGKEKGYYFSDDDLKLAAGSQAAADSLFKAKDDWNTAYLAGDEAGMAAAHKLAEDTRAGANYSGGLDGSEYNPWDVVEDAGRPTYGGYTTPKPTYTMPAATDRPTYTSPYQQNIDALLADALKYPEYTSPYGTQIDDILSSIQNREPFSYDLASDPQFQAYKKMYTREGQRAIEDTMGKYAAMTGGMPSTAAVTAAQQAGDYYNAKLADRIPEFYQLAYSMYQNEGNNLLQQLNMLRGLDSDAYGRYGDSYSRMLTNLGQLRGLEGDDYGRFRDAVGDWENDRDFGYGVYRDQVGDYERDRAFDYGVHRDEVGDWENDRDFDYRKEQDALSWDFKNREYADERGDVEYDRLWNEAITAAKYGDYSKLRELGIDPATVVSGYSGGGGGGGNPPVAEPERIDYTTDRGKAMVKASEGNPALAQQYLLDNWDNMGYVERFSLLQNMGIDNVTAGSLARENGLTGNDFGAYLTANAPKEEEPDQLMADISNIKSEKDAVSYLQNNKIMATPLSREQWAMASGNSVFKTYDDYLKAFVYEYMRGG